MAPTTPVSPGPARATRDDVPGGKGALCVQMDTVHRPVALPARLYTSRRGLKPTSPPLSPFSWSPGAGCRGILGHTAPAGPFPSELVLPLAKPLHPQLSPGAYGSRVGAGCR